MAERQLDGRMGRMSERRKGYRTNVFTCKIAAIPKWFVKRVSIFLSIPYPRTL